MLNIAFGEAKASPLPFPKNHKKSKRKIVKGIAYLPKVWYNNPKSEKGERYG